MTNPGSSQKDTTIKRSEFKPGAYKHGDRFIPVIACFGITAEGGIRIYGRFFKMNHWYSDGMQALNTAHQDYEAARKNSVNYAVLSEQMNKVRQELEQAGYQLFSDAPDFSGDKTH